VQANPRRDLEKAALSLAFPAGLTAYFIHALRTGDWLTSAGWVPSVFSAVVMAALLFLAKPEEGLTPTTVVAMTAMHLMGGATLTLLITIAMPGMPTVPALIPMLLWVNGAALAAFAATDLALLGLLMYTGRKR
jgi:hypothetical protein